MKALCLTCEICKLVPHSEIHIAPSSQESLVMGRFHKEVAEELTQAAEQNVPSKAVLKV